VSWNVWLPGLVLLGVVIFVHELGHFLMAKWRGVRVLKFSLGFNLGLPKPIFAFTRGETEYRLSWFPLGGYVQMAGDSPGEDDSMPRGRDEFLSHPWFGRLLIAVAGPAANLITAFVVLVLVGLLGVSYSDAPNTLGPLPDSSRAWQAGLRPGDRIVAVAGVPVHSWLEIFTAHSKVARREPVTLGLERDGERREVSLAPELREPVMSGLQREPQPPVIGGVMAGMPAYKAGLQVGDRIVAVDGTPIATWEELPRALQGKADRPVQLDLDRDGRAITVTVTPMNADGRPGSGGRIGIEAPRLQTYTERYGVWESVQRAFFGTGAIVASVYQSMWMTVSRPLYYREYLGGPIFIAQAAGEQARRGLDQYLTFLAVINIAIMAFNLLPLPVLDGGHILLALVEAVRRRTISARAYLNFQKVGLVIIAALFLFIFANDPLRLIQRHRAVEKTTQESPVAPSP